MEQSKQSCGQNEWALFVPESAVHCFARKGVSDKANLRKISRFEENVSACMHAIVRMRVRTRVHVDKQNVCFFRGKPTTTHEESDDDQKIQNQSFAPAYRGQQANPSTLPGGTLHLHHGDKLKTRGEQTIISPNKPTEIPIEMMCMMPPSQHTQVSLAPMHLLQCNDLVCCQQLCNMPLLPPDPVLRGVYIPKETRHIPGCNAEWQKYLPEENRAPRQANSQILPTCPMYSTRNAQTSSDLSGRRQASQRRAAHHAAHHTPTHATHHAAHHAVHHAVHHVADHAAHHAVAEATKATTP